MRQLPLVIFTFILILNSFCSTAQSRKEVQEMAVKKFSGCYQTGIESDGFLRLNTDKTFIWAKDTMRVGTWRLKRVSGIPFPAIVVILKFENGKKERHQVDFGDNNDGKKKISLRGEWEMKETICN